MAYFGGLKSSEKIPIEYFVKSSAYIIAEIQNRKIVFLNKLTDS